MGEKQLIADVGRHTPAIHVPVNLVRVSWSTLVDLTWEFVNRNDLDDGLFSGEDADALESVARNVRERVRRSGR